MKNVNNAKINNFACKYLDPRSIKSILKFPIYFPPTTSMNQTKPHASPPARLAWSEYVNLGTSWVVAISLCYHRTHYLHYLQGMVDGSASKPALRQGTGYMIEKTYLDIAPYLGTFASVTQIWFKRCFHIQN